jgi:hypothetical protein
MRPSRFSTSDDGSASLEFITAGFVLLLPLVYLVLTMSSIQAGAFAVEGASRQAARVYVQASTIAEANAAAGRAVEFALADYGLSSDQVSVSVSCRPNPANCLQRRGFVTVTVTTTVPLPLIPPVLDIDVALSVPLESSATQQVSRFAGAG